MGESTGTATARTRPSGGRSERVVPAILAAGTVLAAGSVLLALDLPSSQRELNLVVRPYGVLAPIAIGALWWLRRPNSRIGPLLIGLGALGAVSTLQLTDQPLLAQVGLVDDLFVALLEAYLLLTFPTGSVRTRIERFAVVAMVAAVVLALATVPLVPELRPVDYLGACESRCPANPLYVGGSGGGDLSLARVLFVLVVAVCLSVPVALVYLRRWRTGNRRQRAALLPMAVVSLPLLPLRAVNQIALLALSRPPSAFTDLTWVLVVARMAFPLGFLVALVRSELLASRAMAELVQRLSADRERSTWSRTIAEALDDPSVRVGFRDGSGGFVAADGAPVVRPQADAGRTWIEVSAEPGRPLAALSLDPALEEEPELLEAVRAATRVAAESGELLDDVRLSRSRLVDAADQERRRLGRDLHDSAQQRLVALRVRLSIVADRLGAAGEAAGVPELGAELDQALDDLRSVARGVFPVLLARDGIAAALRSATRAATVPTTIIGDDITRRSESVETAVYFTCLEALQNVAKHGGPGASAAIRLVDEGAGLLFTVTDNGVGFDQGPGEWPAADSPGIGLLTMRDRMAAIGGTLTIRSRPGEGTTITGTVG